jgi:hypothetical protein
VLTSRGRTRAISALAAASVAVLSIVGGASAASGDDSASLTTVGAVAGSTYQTNGVVWALAYANGVMYAGGTFTSVTPAGATIGGSSSVARTNFAAFNATTGALLPCAPAFTISTGTATIRALTASADGNTLYIGGSFGKGDGVGVSNLAALNTSTCTVSSTFHPSVSATVRAIAVNAGSPIYFGGDFKKVNGIARGLAAAVDTTGALLPWNPNAAVNSGDLSIYTSMRAITVSADNTKVALGGDFDTLGGATAHRIGVVDATTGALLETFPGLIDTTSAVKALTHDANNFYLGAEGTGGGVFDGRASVNFSTGVVNWRDTCLGATQTLLVSNGVLYSGSHAHDCTNTPGGFPNGARHHLLAQSAADEELLPWFPDTNGGIGEALGPRAMAMSPDGALWVGGEFTTVNDVAQEGITKFPVKPDNALPAAPAPTVVSDQAGSVHIEWRTVVDPDTELLTYNLYRNGVLINTQSASSEFFNRPQLSYDDTGLTPGTAEKYKLTVSNGTYTTAAGAVVTTTVASASDPYVSSVLANNPTLYWRLDQPSGVYTPDRSTGNDPGVATTGVTYGTPGALTSDTDTAMTFNGSTGNIQSNNLEVGPTTFTLDLWFKTTTTKGGLLIGFGNGNSTNAQYNASSDYDRHIYMTNSGQLIFGDYTGSTQIAESPSAYNNGAWHHVVATSGPTGMHLYVDGTQVATNSNTQAQSYSGYWHVGEDSLGSWPSSPSSSAFSGSIDDVAVYEGVQLTPSQMSTG